MRSCLTVASACLSLVVTMSPVMSAPTVPGAPYINTWLVAGLFENGADNLGFDTAYINEADVQPDISQPAAQQQWRYFDDRLFCRNYDNYQDLFSYFRIKRGEDITAKLAYAHVYLYSPGEQSAQLRLGAESAVKAWFNGELLIVSPIASPNRDSLTAEITVQPGWNRLLLKVANQQAGRLGFYARVCTPEGTPLEGLITSALAPEGELCIATQAMPDAKTGLLPVAFREWPYVGARPLETMNSLDDMLPTLQRKSHLAMHASDFQLQAAGGQAPYTWELTGGELPAGLELNEDGVITGTCEATARMGEYSFKVMVTDAAGARATKDLTMTLKEYPSRWYQDAGLVALIHAPENMPEADAPRFAKTMQQQGYGIGMCISFNNGEMKYRFPNQFEPDHPDTMKVFKTALEAEGVRFGMYMGNLIGPNHNGDDGALLMVQEAMEKYHPAAFWFDWASDNVNGTNTTIDPLFSMIRSIDPDTLIVLNGVNTLYQSDWDVICLEGWGAWGDNHWGLFPFDINWAKKPVIESWRCLTDPLFDYSLGIYPDWQEYLRIQIALIGSGFVANIDHSPTIRQEIDRVEDSVVYQAHMEMAKWASPEGLSPLYESYTKVNKAPLPEVEWGYTTLNLPRDVLYLHVTENPLGKTGMPADGQLEVKAVQQTVAGVTCMNNGATLSFAQDGERVTVDASGITPDPVDTIFRLQLAGAYPQVAQVHEERIAVPPGNLATHKPARLLSLDGSHTLVPSGFAFARYGVDGRDTTVAQGAFEWAWTYEVDLLDVAEVNRIVVHFGKTWATEYEIRLSEDGINWVSVAHEVDCEGGVMEHEFMAISSRYVRIMGLKPDGPDQYGAQMGIAELEVYGDEVAL